MERLPTPEPITQDCLDTCGFARPLGKVGLVGAQRIICALGNKLGVPGECRTGKPRLDRDGQSVCGMYYSPGLIAGVIGATTMLERGYPEFTIVSPSDTIPADEQETTRQNRH